MMLIHYLVLTSALTGVFTWLLLRTLGIKSLPPDTDSDDGGPGPENILPLVDLPPGSSIPFLQTDRWSERILEHR
jgi:hypothetical protein